MKMSRIERAIVLAAGKGTRLAPLTDYIPKPLIAVNGKRMIESIIEALVKNGILEIYVVVGYRKESFSFLNDKYPYIKLIENPFFETCNNISSIYVAREYLHNAMIIEGDLNIRNASILSPDFIRSGYNAVRVAGTTHEWVLQIDDCGIVTSCSRCGGTSGWQLYGISRWSAVDGKLLRTLVEKEFIDKKNTEIYWDEVALFLYREEFELGIFEMPSEAVFEIDSIEELQSIDNHYGQEK